MRCCVDWTEEHHVAGLLGRAMLDRFLALGWLARKPGPRTPTASSSDQCAALKIIEPHRADPIKIMRSSYPSQ